jgi:hypothetical protein
MKNVFRFDQGKIGAKPHSIHRIAYNWLQFDVNIWNSRFRPPINSQIVSVEDSLGVLRNLRRLGELESVR